MNVTSATPAVDPLTGQPATASAAGGTAAGSPDAFLKLLVTQMKNQDPLNPMDNAQITSQLAQISTVNGIQQLNTSVTGLNTQLMQMQALQGASLVGHAVTVDGNQLAVAGGSGNGGFSLPAAASDVTVQVIDASGKVAGTLDLGAQTAGSHSFSWPAGNAADGTPYTFTVSATSGGTAVAATTLMRDTVQSVTSGPGGLMLQTTHSGNVAFSDVVAFD